MRRAFLISLIVLVCASAGFVAAAQVAPATDWPRWRGPKADCNSSPVASGGRIYLSDNDGTTFVVQAGKEFKLLATNPLGERITASPAISGNDLICRTDSHLCCIGHD
jgi:hypothetical protein